MGEIAKPSWEGARDVDGMFFITEQLESPLENETLHKVGYETGWTSGQVEAVCDDYVIEYPPPIDRAYWLLCQSEFTASVEKGDSGSPVFRRVSLSNNYVRLAGLQFGKLLESGHGLFTPMGMLEEHFGVPLLAEYMGPPPSPPDVAIDGPTEIEPEATCNWWADVSDGTPPFTYEWRVESTIVSTDSTYTGGRIGGAPNPFDLYLEVKDDVGQKGWITISVTEDSQADPCLI